MRVINCVILAAIAATSAVNASAQITASSYQNGIVTELYVGSTVPSYPYPVVVVHFAGTLVNPRGCGTNVPWAFRADTPNGRAMYAAVLSAYSLATSSIAINNANSAQPCFPAGAYNNLEHFGFAR